MAIAAGASIKVIEGHLKATGIWDYFDVIVCGDEVENSKPAPDIFLLAAKRMGVNAENCFVFEDSSNGIKAGYAAGMKTIGIADVAPFDSEASQKLFKQFDKIDEAIPILKEYI